MGTFGNLTVEHVGRPDLILMKLAAGRPRDIEDLEALAPTASEIAFVRSQMGRIAAFDSPRALRIRLYLEQGAQEHEHSPTAAPDTTAPRSPIQRKSKRRGRT